MIHIYFIIPYVFWYIKPPKRTRSCNNCFNSIQIEHFNPAGYKYYNNDDPVTKSNNNWTIIQQHLCRFRTFILWNQHFNILICLFEVKCWILVLLHSNLEQIDLFDFTTVYIPNTVLNITCKFYQDAPGWISILQSNIIHCFKKKKKNKDLFQYAMVDMVDMTYFISFASTLRSFFSQCVEDSPVSVCVPLPSVVPFPPVNGGPLS